MHERRERLDRGGIGPVEIVEAEHQRPPCGEPLQQVAQRAVGAVAVERRRPRAGAGQRG
jgi:hypothetical protein